MMNLDQMTENAPLPESELPEILEPDLDQEMVPKAMLLAYLAQNSRLTNRNEALYQQNTKLKENAERLEQRNEEFKEHLTNFHDENRELRKRIDNLIWVKEAYNREQAHKATDWFLLLMLGAVLFLPPAFIVARLLGWL
jgi:hypothetical protein